MAPDSFNAEIYARRLHICVVTLPVFQNLSVGLPGFNVALCLAEIRCGLSVQIYVPCHIFMIFRGLTLWLPLLPSLL